MNLLFTSYSNSASGSSNVSRRYINLLKKSDDIQLSEFYMYVDHNSKRFNCAKIVEKFEAFKNKLLKKKYPRISPLFIS